MWESYYKESWQPKNWCFWTVVLEKTLESPLDCKEIQPVNPKGNQSWIFIGRIDAEAETPILCLLFHVRFQLLLLDLHTDFSRDTSWAHNKSDTTERPTLSLSLSILGTAAPSPNMFLFKLEIGSFVFVFCAHWQAKRNKFGLHTVQQRSDSLEKTLMLENIEGRRRRGWQKIRWLDGLTNSMDMSLNKLQWWTGRPDELQSMGSQRVRYNWVIELDWSVVHQAPLSMEFSRQEYWSGLPCPPTGDLPNPGIEPGLSTLQAESLPSEPPGKPETWVWVIPVNDFLSLGYSLDFNECLLICKMDPWTKHF